MMPIVELIADFAARRHLRRKTIAGRRIALEYRESGRPRLYCDEPAVVARFVSTVRQEVHRRWPEATILLRGQTHDHSGMLPALFRDPGPTPQEALLAAEAYLEEGVHRLMRPRKRFERANLAALLQHYGVRTSWLDVLDDLRAAVWFATHEIPGGVVTRRTCGTGWIYMLSCDPRSGFLDVIDLRVAHQELSLRPHTQQGFSIRGKDRDLNGLVAATVEFPVSDRWILNGHLAEAAFVSPRVVL